MGLLLLVMAIVAFIAGWHFYRKSRVGPAALGTVIYDDAGRFEPEEVLVSHRYGLKGKPDYIVRDADRAFPVEVKSRACYSHGPYDSEKAQLYVYCLLVEELTGKAVSHGVIEYRNRQWPVPFGAAERRLMLHLLNEIRLARNTGDVARNHHDAFRCRNCGFRRADICGQALN